MQNVNQQDSKTSKSNLGLAAKFGIVIAGLKYLPVLLLKGAGAFKFMWIITMFGSMVVSLYAWSIFFGWKFAALLVISLFVHESGHWIWMKFYHLNPKAPIFVPLVGAFVQFGKMATDQSTRAWVAFAGPFVGGIGAAIMLGLGIAFNAGALIAAAAIGFVLNLLQMIPAKPLDGGFIAEAISRKLLIPGALILCAVGLISRSPLFFTIGVISLITSLRTPKVAAKVAMDYQGHSKTIGELEAEIFESSARKLGRITEEKRAESTGKPQERSSSNQAEGGLKNATGKQKLAITGAYILLLFGLVLGLDQSFIRAASNVDCQNSSAPFLDKFIPDQP